MQKEPCHLCGGYKCDIHGAEGYIVNGKMICVDCHGFHEEKSMDIGTRLENEKVVLYYDRKAIWNPNHDKTIDDYIDILIKTLNKKAL